MYIIVEKGNCKSGNCIKKIILQKLTFRIQDCDSKHRQFEANFLTIRVAFYVCCSCSGVCTETRKYHKSIQWRCSACVLSLTKDTILKKAN